MENEKQTFAFFKLACPVFFQAILSLCIGYADMLMVSHFSQDAIGAIGNANQVISFFLLAFMIISSATGIVVAQYIGAKQTERLNKVYTLSICLNLFLGIMVGLILFFFSKDILRVLNVSSELIELSSSYLRIVGSMLFTIALINVFDQIVRSNGKTYIGLIIALSMNGLNIIGNYLFLYGPLKIMGLGFVGVAVSTVISEVIALVIYIIFFQKSIKGKISIKYLFPLPKDELKKLIKIGVPATGENISYDISQLVITAIINLMGTMSLNTKIYCSILAQFSYSFSMAIAVAMSIVVGQSVGAGKFDFIYKQVKKVLTYAMILSVLVATVNYLLSPYILSLFTSESEVLYLGQKVMLVGIFLEIGRTCNIVIIYSLKAAGDVKFPTFLGMTTQWLIAVLLTILFYKYTSWDIVGVWIAMALDEIIRAVFVYVRWNGRKWEKKRIVE